MQVFVIFLPIYVCNLNIGPKNSKLDGHKISESETNKDLTNIKCKVHGQTYYFFCEVCEVVVCNECITNNHVLYKITDIYKCTNLNGKITQVKTKEEKDEMLRAILTAATTLAERRSARNDNTNGQPDMDRENITTPFVEYIPETFKTGENLQILEQYKTNIILVDIILCGTGGTFWISDFKNELVENVTFADGLIHDNKKINEWACDLASAPSELVLSTLDDSLRLIQQKSEKIKE